MKNLNELIQICKQYISGCLSIEDLQYKIENIVLPQECKKTLEIKQHNLCNQLEEIRFCYSESQREYANEVVKNFVEEIIKEEERLKG